MGQIFPEYPGPRWSRRTLARWVCEMLPWHRVGVSRGTVPRPCVPSHTPGPCHSQVAPERRPCSQFQPPRPALSCVQAALSGPPSRQLCFPASSPFRAPRGQRCGEKPTEKLVRELGWRMQAGMRGQWAEERVPGRKPYHRPLCSHLPRGLVMNQPRSLTHP